MIRDRLPDLLLLAQVHPELYFEPEIQEEVPMPPDLELCLQRVEKILKFVRELEAIIKNLQHLQQSVLTSSSVMDTNQLRVKITLSSNRFSALARKTETILLRIELSDQEKLRYSSKNSISSDRIKFTVKWEQTSSSVKVNWPRPSLSSPIYVPAEVRMKVQLHDVLSRRLTGLVGQFYSDQKTYSELSQQKIERQLSILGKTMKQEEITRVIDENIPLLQQDIQDDKQVSKEMRLQLKEMAHYEKEIFQLEKNITQLHKTFLLISQFVHEQGVMVDNIAKHVSMASDYIESSNQLLKKAGKLQNKYRKKKLILAIIIIIILLIVVAIIAISIVEKQHQHSSR